jgi:hypothetical protein
VLPALLPNDEEQSGNMFQFKLEGSIGWIKNIERGNNNDIALYQGRF